MTKKTVTSATMRRLTGLLGIGWITCALLLPGTASAGENPNVRNLSAEQEVVNTIMVPEGDLEVKVTVGNHRGTYSLGDTLDLYVETSRDAYVTVLNIGVDGVTTVLYPYLDGTDNLVKAGKPVAISGQGTGVIVRFRAPAGTDLVKAFASTSKVPLLDSNEITRLNTHIGQAKSLARNLVPEVQAAIDDNASGVVWATDTIKVTSVDGSTEQETRDRSLFKPGESSARDLVVILNPRQTPPAGSEVSVYLPVRFAHNSAALSSAARRNLAVVAEAMQAPQLAGTVFIVEGHTDASGSVAYNDGLSLRRARAATDYLVRLGVARSRLAIRGYGERDLLPEHSPRSARQRRVEFVRNF